jgi:hypothetical protein
VNIKVWQPSQKVRQTFFVGCRKIGKGCPMKIAISKSPGFYLSVAIAIVIIMVIVKALPETWGLKKYFTA